MTKYTSIVLLLIAACIVLSEKATGHSDFRPFYSGNSFMIGGEAGGGETGIVKVKLLMKLLDDMSRELFNDTVFVSVRIGMDSFYRGDRLLSYKQDYVLNWKLRRASGISYHGLSFSKPLPENILSLNIAVDKLNVANCLKLIYYAFTHKKEIERAQKPILSKTWGPEERLNYYDPTGFTFYGYHLTKSISSAKIDQILAMKFPELDRYLGQKYYRRWSRLNPGSGLLDFYVQNNECYIYELTEEHLAAAHANGERKQSFTDIVDKPLYKFALIENLISDGKDNYLIFTPNDSFYHFVLSAKQLHGPFAYQLNKRLCEMDCNFDSMTLVSDGVFRLSIQSIFGRFYANFYATTGVLEPDTQSYSRSIKDYLAYLSEQNSISAPPKRRNLSFSQMLAGIAIFAFAALAILFRRNSA